MEVINDTGLQAAWLQGRIQFPAHSLSLIVKGTFRLSPGGVAALDEEEEQPPVTGDAFYDDEPENGCRYQSDFVHFKPRADVSLAGTCHAPSGGAVASCRASFGIGDRVKSLAVFGDRVWSNSGSSPRPSDPVPFTTMPIDYRQAFGGKGFDQNPLGKGSAATGPNGTPRWPLPNVTDPKEAVGLPGQASRPAGFGPLGNMWPQRRVNMGTYDEAWKNERWPWYPADFDWAHFNAAPADQQVEGYLRGDEALYFENLHPTHPEYRTRLPDLRVRCFLKEDYKDQALVREVPMNLDTLWVDMDAEQVVLIWRGLVKVQSEEIEELKHLMIVTEPLGQAPLSAEHYAQQLSERLAEAEAGQADDGAMEPEAPEPDIEVDLAAIEADVKTEVMAALDEMQGKLKHSRVDFARVKSILAASDPVAALNDIMAKAGIDPAQAQAAMAQGQQHSLALLKQHGLDPELARQIETGGEDEDEDDIAAAEQASARAQPGASFVGEDLSGADFSSRDLSGADFTDAILTGTNFADANLSKADFTKATLGNANLREANLTGAKLDDADLTKADLSAANLSRASLAGTIFEEAMLINANLAEVSAPGASFLGADLTNANLAAAKLEKADLSKTTLNRTNLTGAVLARAEFLDAAGTEVTMTGADVTELRAGRCQFPGGVFQNLRGEASQWFESDLSGSDFTGSALVRADFREADLQHSNFHAVDLKSGNLTKAQMHGARFTSVNLFQVRLDKADLSDADLRDSNCYEADFVDAEIAGANFNQANLKNTKLAQLHTQG